jgi:hypothetical protein
MASLTNFSNRAALTIFSILITLFFLSSAAFAASVTLAWDPPNDPAVKGYNIYYGLSGTSFKTSPGSTINSATQTQIVISGLDEGKTYQFAATSHDGNGRESDFSAEISYKIPVSVYSVSAAVLPGETGTISSGGFNCRNNCSTNFASGSSPVFAITPDSAYRVTDVKINGSSIGPATSYTFTNISANQSISASFALKQYTINASAGTGGSISPSGAQTVNHGDSASYTITAATGYKISSVTVNGVSVGAVSNYTFSNITRNNTIYASFVASEPGEKSYTITSSAGTGGYISPSGDTVVASNGSISYSIVADSGYVIADVTVNGSSVGAVGSYTISNVTSDGTITARFSGIDEEPIDKEPVDESKLPPGKPVLMRPAANAELAPEEEIVLETDLYYHPNGNAHITSHWQIRRADEKKALYSFSCNTDLVSHKMTDGLEEGLKYAWRTGFEDIESGLVAWSDERFFVIGNKVVHDQNPPVSSGKSNNDYEMVSFGHWPPDAASEMVFGALLETDYNLGDYKILAYDPNYGRNGGYREYPDFEVTPGRSYWVLARNGLNLTTLGVPVTNRSDIYTALDYNASSGDGWTMIAVPNDASYYWGDLIIVVHDGNGEILYGPMPISQLSNENPYIDPRLWASKNRQNQYEIHDSKEFLLTPYGGYWVRARHENVSLSFPYDMQAPSSATELNEDDGKIMSPASIYDDTEPADENEMPPMLPSGLDDGPFSSRGDKSSSGCFIGTVSKK